jgi:hypothetical protein
VGPDRNGWAAANNFEGIILKLTASAAALTSGDIYLHTNYFTMGIYTLNI